jgi:hypothetical protein
MIRPHATHAMVMMVKNVFAGEHENIGEFAMESR